MDRAYSLLTITKADAEARVVEGIASTPETDRVGDQVVSTGAKWKRLPLPWLMQHRHDEPIGHIEWLDARPDGIRFRARMAKVDEPATLRERLDNAWGEIRAGLVRGISIGFRSIKAEPIATGFRFTEWELFEISSVTIPANASCSIQTIKRLDRLARGEMGIGKVTSREPVTLWKTLAESALSRSEEQVRKAQALVQELRAGGFKDRDVLPVLHADSLIISDIVRRLADRVEALEGKVKSFSTMVYRGVWADGARHKKGDVVTFGGSLWHCNRATGAKPGDDPDAWTLCCKKGRDGKGASA